MLIKKSISIAMPLVLICSTAMARFTPPTKKEAEAETREAALNRFSSPTAASTRSAPPPVTAAAGTNQKSASRLVGSHLTFDDHIAAAEWLRPKSQELATGLGAKKFVVLNDHAYRPVIQNYVDELWRGFVELFPEQTAGLSSPPVVIIESETSNAFVETENNVAGHAVYVLTGLVDEAGGVDKRDNLTGILAHEIAHSVFMHGIKSVSQKVQRFFKVRDGLPIGFDSPREEELQSAMNQYLQAARSVGDVHVAALRDLPSPGFGNPYMTRVWGRLRQELSVNSPSCSAEQGTMKSWSGLVRFSSLNYEYGVVPESLALLDKTSAQLVDNQRQCFVPKMISFIGLMAKALNVPEQNLVGSPELQRLQKVFEGAGDPVSGLQAVVRLDRKVMDDVANQVDKTLGVAALGYYTTEQHADDASALVHARLDRDPAMFSHLLRIMMKNIRAEDRGACEAILQDPTKTPALGSFFVIHHSYCYRIYHFARMAEKIRTANTGLNALAKEFIEKSMGNK